MSSNNAHNSKESLTATDKDGRNQTTSSHPEACAAVEGQTSASLSRSAKEKLEDKYALANGPTILVKEVTVKKEDK
ncbi:hypothetical protein BGX26_009488, partial [Mortierella sp. AD094]